MPMMMHFAGLARQEAQDNEFFNAVIGAGMGFGLTCQVAGLGWY